MCAYILGFWGYDGGKNKQNTYIFRANLVGETDNNKQ